MRQGGALGLVVSLMVVLSPFLSACAATSSDSTDASVEHLKDLFDRLDNQVNDGNGYKDYLNPDGFPTGALLAWSESYLMQAYAEMFRATGDEEYLDKLFEHTQSVLDNRDDFRGQLDYRGHLAPAWGTDRYTEGGEWTHFVVHTGMITFPMLEFVLLVREYGVSRLSAEAEDVLSRVEESIRYHDDEWAIQEAGYGLYVYPEDLYHQQDYACPLSQQATMGRSLLLLWQLTQKDQYLAMASDIAIGIKASLRDDRQGGYVWGVFIDDGFEDDRVPDVSHSAATIHFAVLAHEAGVVFNRTDIQRFATTVRNVWQDGRVTHYIDGSGAYDYEVAAGEYAFLAKYDPQIWNLCYDVLLGSCRVDVTASYFQEDWWGATVLGIARLARFAPSGLPTAASERIGARN